jgi:hypothetical protein
MAPGSVGENLGNTRRRGHGQDGIFQQALAQEVEGTSLDPQVEAREWKGHIPAGGKHPNRAEASGNGKKIGIANR